MSSPVIAFVNSHVNNNTPPGVGFFIGGQSTSAGIIAEIDNSCAVGSQYNSTAGKIFLKVSNTIPASSSDWIDLSAGGGSGVIQNVTITLSAAQIKALKATPVQLIAAPGLGKAIICLQIIGFLKYGTVPYANADNLIGPAYGTDQSPFGGTMASFGGMLTGNTEDKIEWGPDFASGVTSAAILDNAAVNFINTGADELINGDSTLTIIIYYTEILLQ